MNGKGTRGRKGDIENGRAYRESESEAECEWVKHGSTFPRNKE